MNDHSITLKNKIALRNKLLAGLSALAPGQDFRKRLLGGSSMAAILAVGIAVGVAQVSPAYAADIEIDNADGTTDGLFANDADTIINTVDDTDFLSVVLSAKANDTIATIDSDFSATITLTDSDATAANTFIVTGAVGIESGTTLTLLFGNTKSDSSGTDGIEALTMTVGGNIGDELTGTATGGTLVLQGANDVTGDFGGVFTAAGDVTLTALTVTAGDGGTNEGSGMTVTLGNASGDTINILTLTATGGAGGGTDAGGASLITVTGTLSDATGGIDINGGAGLVAVAGGTAKIVITEAVAALSGAVTIDGGAAGSTTGAGATAELETTAGLTASSVFTITGGIGASGAGDADGGAATLDVNGAFVTTKAVTFAGGAAGTGTTDAANGGAALGEFASTIDVLGLTLTGADGGANAANVGGAATVTVAAGATVGASGITMTAGDGGAFAGAARAGRRAVECDGATGRNGGDVWTRYAAFRLVER